MISYIEISRSSRMTVSFVAVLTAASPTLAQEENSQPGTLMSPDEIITWASPIRAGERLRPETWPNGAKVAVVLGFDVDNETWALPAGGVPNLGVLSEYQYGAKEALPRILRELDERNLPATFFVPGAADILAPETIPSIMKSGRHEIAMHSWVHENVRDLPNVEEEERLMRLAYDYIEEKAGKAPVGMRTGSWAVSEHTIPLAEKMGLLYDSSLMAYDEPYQLIIHGEKSSVIELPVSWLLDDAPFLGARSSLPSPELVFQVYKDEFDVALEEGSVYMLTTHPQTVGRRSRFLHLQYLLDHIQAQGDDVWFTTAAELAQYVNDNVVSDEQ